MKTALAPLQTTVYKVLSQYSPLRDVINGVYVGVPESAVMPYVNIGNPTATRDDSKNSEGEELTRTIHIWEQSSEYKCQQIMNLVLQGLTDEPISMPGYTMWDVDVELMDIQDDPQQYKHGVMRLRFKVEHQ